MRYFKYGAWACNKQLFETKKEALLYSSSTGLPVSFYYHNNIWEKFNVASIIETDLDALYKERAQQLRDRYNHLILYYSGGSDSNNILMTFLKNNIVLDEVVVKWQKPLIDQKFYIPNNKDTSARNSASEWDYSVKPTLNFLKQYYPHIKITIQDFTNKIYSPQYESVKFWENRLENIKSSRVTLSTVLQRSDYELQHYTYFKKNTGHIYGVEKPRLFVKDGWINFMFTDVSLENSLMEEARDNESVELFYWSPDLPQLPVAQAYKVAEFFNNNQHLIDILLKSGKQDYLKNVVNLGLENKLVRHVLYPTTWTERFQADKPNMYRSDWWFWLHESEELDSIRNSFNTASVSYFDRISQEHLIIGSIADPIMLKPLSTPAYPLLKITSK